MPLAGRPKGRGKDVKEQVQAKRISASHKGSTSDDVTKGEKEEQVHADARCKTVF